MPALHATTQQLNEVRIFRTYRRTITLQTVHQGQKPSFTRINNKTVSAVHTRRHSVLMRTSCVFYTQAKNARHFLECRAVRCVAYTTGDVCFSTGRAWLTKSVITAYSQRKLRQLFYRWQLSSLVVYGYEIWSLPLMLTVSGQTADKIKVAWRKLRCEVSHNLFF